MRPVLRGERLAKAGTQCLGPWSIQGGPRKAEQGWEVVGSTRQAGRRGRGVWVGLGLGLGAHGRTGRQLVRCVLCVLGWALGSGLGARGSGLAGVGSVWVPGGRAQRALGAVGRVPPSSTAIPP